MDLLLFLRCRLAEVLVRERLTVNTNRLSFDVSQAELLQYTMASTIANTGDRIVVTQPVADIAVQREAMAASTAAMSSAAMPAVPAG